MDPWSLWIGNGQWGLVPWGDVSDLGVGGSGESGILCCCAVL